MNTDDKPVVLHLTLPDPGMLARFIYGSPLDQLFGKFQLAPPTTGGGKATLKLGIKSGDRAVQKIHGEVIGLAVRDGYIFLLVGPVPSAALLLAWQSDIAAGKVRYQGGELEGQPCTAFAWEPNPGRLFAMPLPKGLGEIVVEIP